jgi:hypothetical protein
MSAKREVNRRRFLASTAVTATFTVIPRHVLGAPGRPSANDRLNIAAVGAGGMTTRNGSMPAKAANRPAATSSTTRGSWRPSC